MSEDAFKITVKRSDLDSLSLELDFLKDDISLVPDFYFETVDIEGQKSR